MDGLTFSGADRWRPPLITAEAASWLRALGSRRPMFAAGGLRLWLASPPTRIVDPAPVGLRLGAHAAALTLPGALAAHLLVRLDPAAPAAAPPLRPLLLALAVEPALRDLTAAGQSLVPVALDPAAEVRAPALVLGIVVEGAGTRHVAELALDAGAAGVLAAWAGSVPPSRAAWPDLPVPLHLRLLAADLTLAEARRIATGDVVLANAPPGTEAILVAAEHVCWGMRDADGGWTVATGRRRPANCGWRDWMAMEPQDETPNDAALDELPVRLVFETGRVEVTLAELETIGPGWVFPLGRGADAPLDILANGRRFGTGELVRIGETLGVRVLRIGAERDLKRDAKRDD